MLELSSQGIRSAGRGFMLHFSDLSFGSALLREVVGLFWRPEAGWTKHRTKILTLLCTRMVASEWKNDSFV